METKEKENINVLGLIGTFLSENFDWINPANDKEDEEVVDEEAKDE